VLSGGFFDGQTGKSKEKWLGFAFNYSLESQFLIRPLFDPRSK
jgi:hypothetical protein